MNIARSAILTVSLTVTVIFSLCITEGELRKRGVHNDTPEYSTAYREYLETRAEVQRQIDELRSLIPQYN